MGKLLIDNQGFFAFRLEEASAGKGDKIIMRGQFARSDKATENKRLYRESLWRREFNRLNEAMENRRMYGELDHPSDGRTKLQRVSHLVTGLRIDGNEVIGEAEVLDTPNGRILKTLAKANAQVGVSSRGFGSTKQLPNGDQEVQEDFKLDTFDFVADPATRTAYPQVFAEEREHIKEAELLTPDILKRDYPGLVEELISGHIGTGGITARDLTEAEERAERRASDKMATNLRRAVELAEGDIRSEVRSELMSDPKVAGALGLVEQIVGLVKSYGFDPDAGEELMVKDDELSRLKGQLEDKALEIHKLQQEAATSKALIRELAYKLHLEHLLGKDSKGTRAAVESLLGDVTKFESKEEIDTKVSAIKAELDRRGGPAPAEDAASAAELKKAQEDLDAAKAQVVELEAKITEATKAQAQADADSKKARETADKALGIAESFEARLYAERKLSESALGAEDRTKIRELCESATSVSKVDAVFNDYVPQRTPDSDEVTRIRERVGRGKTHDQRLEEDGSRPTRVNGKGPEMLEEVGVTGGKGEFDRLAGTRHRRA